MIEDLLHQIGFLETAWSLSDVLVLPVLLPLSLWEAILMMAEFCSADIYDHVPTLHCDFVGAY